MVYLIVEFKNSAEIALVPNNWLLDDNIVKWPPYKTSSRLNNAVVKKEPPSDTWTDQEIERVLYRNESFEKARAKLTQAEVDSDLQSDDCGDKKRKRRAPNRIIDSDDSDESDPEPEPVLKKVVKPPPRLPLSASLRKSPTQSTSSVGMSQLARARDAQFLTLLEKIIAEQKEQRRLLQLIISKGPAVEENSLTLPEGVTFPIKSVDDMDSFNELLQESEVYSRVVKYLSLIGGTTVWETINRLMKEVMSNDIAVLYNVHGKKGKHALYKLRIMDVLYRALQRNPTTKNATRKDMELELRKWLAGARDREGGRKKRADKKNNPLPPPQNHMEHSDTETQNE